MIFLIPAALLWAVALWRAPAALRDKRKRPLWSAFLGLAIAITIKPVAVASALDAALGLHNVATLGKHLAGILAAHSVLTFVHDMADERRPELRGSRQHVAVPVAAAVGLTVLFLAAPQPREVDDILTSYATDWRIALYGLIWCAFLATALLSATRLCRQWGRHPEAGLLGRGLLLTGTGTAIGMVYAAHRVFALVLRFLEVDALSVDTDRVISNGLLFGALLFIIAGSTLPVGRRLTAWYAAHRDLVALHPLWFDVTSATPGVRYEPPRGRIPEALDFRRSRARLYRRGIEIRDAVLVLGSHTPAPLREKAQAYVTDRGLVGAEAAVTAEACWVRTTRIIHSDKGHSTKGLIVPPASGGPDLSSETQALKQLPTAYRSDLVRDFALANSQDPR
ncbi:MAB_1171c family putative transporter [Streptomyces sp. NPDC060194]|uniref:MAB_1171c family putative transporter n=1 Tax=Streptomyces sp. NPDC060194 TaxID=3347069 RepID=UPI00364E7357